MKEEEEKKNYEQWQFFKFLLSLKEGVKKIRCSHVESRCIKRAFVTKATQTNCTKKVPSFPFGVD